MTIKYPVQPRLLPNGSGYTCDACHRTWKIGKSSGCMKCYNAIAQKFESQRKRRHKTFWYVFSARYIIDITKLSLMLLGASILLNALLNALWEAING